MKLFVWCMTFDTIQLTICQITKDVQKIIYNFVV